jgi:serine/threonine protein kinase
MGEEISLGKYEIIKELGRGGFGIVYEARDTILKRQVALKVLHPNLTVDPHFIARFRQEAELAARMDHPNIVTIHDFDQVDGRYYIVMALLRGGSLNEQIETYGPLSPAKARTFLEQIASGLSYAHQRGVIHRDLKPGNILIDENGIARVADFGFAKASSNNQSTAFSSMGNAIGTAAYMAPEIWEGKPATAQSDIYSLGCIAAEMLTGRRLFDGDSTAQILKKHVVDGPKLPANLPEAWRELILTCLAKDPAQRYPSVNALLEDLKWGHLQSAIVAEQDEPAQVPHGNSNEDGSELVQYSLEYIPAESPVQVTPPRVKVANAFPVSQTTSRVYQAESLQNSPRVDFNQPWQTPQQAQSTSTYDSTPNPIENSRYFINQTKPQKKRSKLWFLLFALVFVATSFAVFFIFFFNSPKNDSKGANTLIQNAIANQFSANQTPKPDEVTENHESRTSEALVENEVALEEPTPLPTNTPEPSPTPVFTPQAHPKAINATNVHNIVLLKTLTNHTEIVYSIGFSPDGKIMASGSKDQTIILWDTENFQSIRSLYGHSDVVRSVAFSPDGTILASGSWDRTVRLWNTETWELIRTLYGHSGEVMVVNFSPDGKLLASAAEDGSVRLWEVETGLLVRVIPAGLIEARGASFSPDGKTLATGANDLTLKLWDVETGQLLRILDSKNYWIGDTVWSPDGSKLACRSGQGVNIYDPERGERLLLMPALSTRIATVHWSRDGEMVMSGCSDTIGRVWDAETGQLLKSINQHSSEIWDMLPSPDGRYIVTASSDKTIQIWGLK